MTGDRPFRSTTAENGTHPSASPRGSGSAAPAGTGTAAATSDSGGPTRLSIRAFFLTLVLAAAVAGTAEPPSVDPGRVVRWPGDPAVVTSCLMDGRALEPVEGDCWFPVDLLTPPGDLEIGRVRNGRTELRTVRVADYPYPVQRLTVDPSKVHLSEEDAARAGREAARVAELWRLDGPRRFQLPLAPPLEEMPSGGRFGSRRVFNDVPRSPHSGIDLAAPTGTPVLAVADGVVRLAEEHFFAGKSVFVDHGDGLVSMAFHLSRIAVSEGETVRRGQRIGAVGATGRATGPHLHFGVRWHGSRVDPRDLLAGGEPPTAFRDEPPADG